MKYSCNGCRVLRKGCSEDCSIRPCLEWIKSPSAQSNATLFLAKFYGRAGLLNLLSAAPDPLRPSIFRSLLEEACGRIVNPIYGSTGLISSGNWHLCEAAVEAVLNGSPITQIPTESTVENLGTVFNACDIRHVSNKDKEPLKKSNKVKNQTRFKRSKPKSKTVKPADESSMGDSVGRDGSGVSAVESVETDEDTLAKPNKVGHDVALRLTLGFHTLEKTTATDEDVYGSGNEMADFELRLGLPEVC